MDHSFDNDVQPWRRLDGAAVLGHWKAAPRGKLKPRAQGGTRGVPPSSITGRPLIAIQGQTLGSCYLQGRCRGWTNGELLSVQPRNGLPLRGGCIISPLRRSKAVRRRPMIEDAASAPK